MTAGGMGGDEIIHRDSKISQGDRIGIGVGQSEVLRRAESPHIDAAERESGR